MINEDINTYCENHSNLPSPLAKELGNITRKEHTLGRMVCGEQVGSLLGFLILSLNAKNILEIGTFTGYSALCMAELLPSDGKVVTVDKNKKIGPFAKSYWDRSEHGNKITQLNGNGPDVVKALDEKFDLIFIDADKGNYIKYLELSLDRLNSNGVIVVDNVLWSGKVTLDDSELQEDKGALSIKRFNEYVKERADLYATLLPIRDGIYLIKKL